jgi:hypothetical protein
VGSPAHGKQKAATGDGNGSCKKDWAVVEVLLKKAHEKPNEPVLSVKWLELARVVPDQGLVLRGQPPGRGRRRRVVVARHASGSPGASVG